jgi:hypothetical protein
MKRRRSRRCANCVFLINMIRSGLVNQRRGGGFEEGFPHQRDNNPRDEVIRPYVDGIDTGFGTRSDISQIIPTPVSYDDIFGKKATPSERLYLFKMSQKSKKAPRLSMRAEMQGLPEAIPPKLPQYKEPTKPVEPVEPREPEQPREPSIEQPPRVEEEGYLPDLIMEDVDDEELLNDELMAEEVVYPPIHQETYEEDMAAVESWTDQTPVVQHTHAEHIADDVLTLTENNFGADVEISTAEPVLEVPPQVTSSAIQAVQINGIGPRRNTDSNRLKAIQKRSRLEAMSESRTIGPLREEVSRWKTSEERAEEKQKKYKSKTKSDREKKMMSGRDFKKLGGPASVPEIEPAKEKPFSKLPETPSKKAPKKAAPSKRSGVDPERVTRVSERVKRKNLELIIARLTKKENELKAKGKKLTNRQAMALYQAEKDLKEMNK